MGPGFESLRGHKIKHLQNFVSAFLFLFILFMVFLEGTFFCRFLFTIFRLLYLECQMLDEEELADRRQDGS